MEAAAVDDVLPLADHAVAAVVDHHHLDRQLVLDDRRQLLGAHHEAPVAVDEHDQSVRPADLGADGRRQAVAHGPEPPEVSQCRGWRKR